MKRISALVLAILLACPSAYAAQTVILAAGHTAATSTDVVVTGTGQLAMYPQATNQSIDLPVYIVANSQEVVVGHLTPKTPTFAFPYPGTYRVKRTDITAAGLDVGVTSDLNAAGSSTTAVTQSGNWDIRNITGTVSLPTGAATAARQPAVSPSQGAGVVDSGTLRVVNASDGPTVAALGATTDAAVGDATGSINAHERQIAANSVAEEATAGSTKYKRTISCVVTGLCSGAASYSAVVTGYTAYATPTDTVCLSGSSSKLVIISALTMLQHSTSATLLPVFWIKRSTLNTGGTSATATGVPADSADSAATATLTYWTAAPTLGTTVGTYSMTDSTTTTLTATAASPSFTNNVAAANLVTYTKPVVLRNANESLCVNFAGAALPGGYTSSIIADWSEQTAP